MKKKLTMLLILLLVGVMAVGCGGSDTPKEDGGSTSSVTEAFKIGGTAPLTGGASVYGMAAKNGAQIAVDEINALGGIQFELRYEDDEHDAEKAVNAYNNLKDWGMQISLGSVTSTPAVATSVENFNDRIFALTPSASATQVPEGKDNVYQMCFSDPNQGTASALYISEKNLASKVAVIYRNDDVYSTGIYDTFIEEADRLGLEVVSATTFTKDSANDFTVQLTDAKNAGADLVFLPMYYEPASLIFQQSASMGYAPKFFGVDGMDGILTMEGFDVSLAEGVMLLTPFNADAEDENTKKFVEKYQKDYGVIPNQFAADAYDCIYAIHQALEAEEAITASSSNEEINTALIKQFTSMTYDGLTGDGMTWTADGLVSKSPKGMTIVDGAYVGMD